MPAPIKPISRDSVRPRVVAMTPYALYLEQVKGLSDNLRYQAQGLTYIPSQFGGLKGQLQTISEQVVLKVIDFESTGS